MGDSYSPCSQDTRRGWACRNTGFYPMIVIRRGRASQETPSRGGNRPMSVTDSRFRQQFFHGTRADFQHGDLIAVGFKSNYGEGRFLSFVYCTGTLDAAIWGAELA